MTADTPKPLKEMTDAEIGALVRAHKEGKVIQTVGRGRSEWIDCDPQWRWYWAYRIRPEPVRDTVTLYGAYRYGNIKSWSFIWRRDDATHRLTLPTIDGTIPAGTYTSEYGHTITVEGL